MARIPNQSRVYLVKRGTVESLIRAGSKSAAIAHVMSDVSAEIATQDEIISALSAGGKVEEAKEPETKPATEPAAEPEKPAKGKK